MRHFEENILESEKIKLKTKVRNFLESKIFRFE